MSPSPFSLDPLAEVAAGAELERRIALDRVPATLDADGLRQLAGRAEHLEAVVVHHEVDEAAIAGDAPKALLQLEIRRLDLRGNLVGINTAIFNRDQGSSGIGFAIPSIMVRALIASDLDAGALGIGVPLDYFSVAVDEAELRWAKDAGSKEPKESPTPRERKR